MKPTLPDNLTDDDLALLRLAGELPAGVAAPDGPADLRDAFAAFDGLLRRDADRQSLPPAAIAARSVVRAMNDALEAPVEPKRAFKLRVPGWAIYPAAAAAVLIFGMFGWWYSVHDEFAHTNTAYQPDAGPPVLIFPGGTEPLSPDADISDAQIARQFDSLILPERPNGGEVERQYAALKFLEETMQ